MVILATMALVWGVVAIGAAFFRHLRDYSSDVYDKVNEKSQKKNAHPPKKDNPPQP